MSENEMDAVHAAWKRWVDSVCICPRISVNHGRSTVLPFGDCPCGECEEWRRANRLHDNYRRIAGLPV